VAIVSVSIPDSLVEQLDGLIKARGYAGRSEAVRAALRDFLVHELQQVRREGPRSASMTLVYPEGHERRIGDIRHDYGDVIKSMMHSHAEDHCVELFSLQGRAARIREFADRLRSYRDTRLVEVIYTDLDEAAEAQEQGKAPRL
jgi:CopG family transcriptional regulator, nickel-responsive regulator